MTNYLSKLEDYKRKEERQKLETMKTIIMPLTKIQNFKKVND